MAGHTKFGSEKTRKRIKRKGAIRKRINGTDDRPRLSVFRSARYVYAQAIDDTTNIVLASASDREEDLAKSLGGKKKKDKAKAIGAAVAKKLLAKNVQQVVFDRNGFIYHGRVSAVADGAREAGLKF